MTGSSSQVAFRSSKLLDSRRRSLDDLDGSGSIGRKDGSQNMEHSPTRHIRDLAVLEFKSWWTETIQGMEKGSSRRYMDLLFSCETGQFQVILDRSDKVYTLSHIEGKNGPLEAWDLYVGARINVLGRTTTLKQASGSTLEWQTIIARGCSIKSVEEGAEEVFNEGEMPFHSLSVSLSLSLSLSLFQWKKRKRISHTYLVSAKPH